MLDDAVLIPYFAEQEQAQNTVANLSQAAVLGGITQDLSGLSTGIVYAYARLQTLANMISVLIATAHPVPTPGQARHRKTATAVQGSRSQASFAKGRARHGATLVSKGVRTPPEDL